MLVVFDKPGNRNTEIDATSPGGGWFDVLRERVKGCPCGNRHPIKRVIQQGRWPSKTLQSGYRARRSCHGNPITENKKAASGGGGLYDVRTEE